MTSLASKRGNRAGKNAGAHAKTAANKARRTAAHLAMVADSRTRKGVSA